jgi:hypothetical protein
MLLEGSIIHVQLGQHRRVSATPRFDPDAKYAILDARARAFYQRGMAT